MAAAASSDAPRRGKFPILSLIVCAACGLAAAALAYPALREKIAKIEYWTADWRTVLLADRISGNHPRVIVVNFDPATFDGGVISPIPRDTHAGVLRALDVMQPAVIAPDFYFVAGQTPERDQIFLDTLHELRTPVVLGAVDEHTAEFSDKQKAYQQAFLAKAGRPAGYLALRYDPGHIVRRTSPPLAGSPFQESFARQIVLASGAHPQGLGASSQSMRIAWLLGPGQAPQPFLTLSAKELLPGADTARLKELAGLIKGNVVLTGIDMPNSDRHDTALSVWTEEQMLGVLIHAQIVARLLDGRYIYELVGMQRALFLLAIALAGLALGWLSGHRRAAFINLGVATAILVGIDALCYSSLRIVLPITLALYVWFLGAIAGRHLQTLAAWAANRASPAV